MIQPTRTQFRVLIWLVETPAPYAIISVIAKMPLSALAFAMEQQRLTRAEYVLVCWDDPDDPEYHFEHDFWHVKIVGTCLTYDRAVPDSSV